MARSFSDGPTASEGGDLGQYKRGQLPKVLEDKTFSLKAGQYTDPILTRQGYIILKVVQHTPGGPAAYKDVEEQVEEALYMSRMEPAIRDYLNKMRDEAAIFIKAGYVDYREPPMRSFIPASPSAPTCRPRRRRRPRLSGRASAKARTLSGRSRRSTAPPPEQAAAPAKDKEEEQEHRSRPPRSPARRRKIRFGQAPRETLPVAATNAATENAGALPETADNSQQPVNPLEPTRSAQKTRFSARAREPRKSKSTALQPDALAPEPPDAAEVADQETQSAPLGLSGDTSGKKKKKARNQQREDAPGQKKKNPAESEPPPPPQPTPIAPVPGAPAPASAPPPPQ